MTEAPNSPRRSFSYDDETVISYEAQGDGPVPVVFLHGFAAGLITWHDIRPLFPPSRFRLYLPDLKGFGFSSKPCDGRYTPEDQAAVVLSFMKSLGLRHAVLVGHSLGGGIALLALWEARRDGMSDLIDRLILIDCAAYPQRLPRIMRLLRRPLLGRAIIRLLPVRFMVVYSLRHVFHDKGAITPQRIDRYVTCFGRKGIDRVFAATCRQLAPERYADLAPSFHGITVPTLIIWGGEDRFIPAENGGRLQRDIPGSRLVVIGACGHNPHEERPGETFAAMAEFLAMSRELP
ncbi:MAG TPA: alpha/beta hydrolase [Geobacteraceae bacterium]